MIGGPLRSPTTVYILRTLLTYLSCHVSAEYLCEPSLLLLSEPPVDSDLILLTFLAQPEPSIIYYTLCAFNQLLFRVELS